MKVYDEPFDGAAPAHTDALLTLPAGAAGALSIRAKAMLFEDPRSQRLLREVERVARSEATVLMIGETGTGKELIARHIHRQSGRRGPFLAVNCGAFSESLIDAELFGHEAGAFTGAATSRAGWFEAADGGTLFLDEIGDLPLPLQVKLLRVLQERQVVRLGSRKAVSLDVRLVAATNIDLQRAVEAQHFRADLYWRLSVATLDLPPLRERPGDVLPLARHFVSVYGPRLGLTHVQFSDAAQAALQTYIWPGNVRELENVVHFGLIVCRGGVIEPEDLKLVHSRRTSGALAPAPVPAPAPVAVSAGNTALATPGRAGQDAADDLVAVIERLLTRGTDNLFDELEGTLVRCAFRFSHENQVRAARALGVTRNTMRTLLKRYGLLVDAADSELPQSLAG